MEENLKQRLLNSQQELIDSEDIHKKKLEKITRDQKEIAFRIIDSNRVMKAKLDQLDTWLTQTFEHCEPPHGDDNINKASRLYNSEFRKDLIDLVRWLQDSEDNYKEYFFKKKTAKGHFIHYKFFLII